MTLASLRLLALALALAPAARADDEVIVDDEDGAPEFQTTTENWDTWSIGSYGYDSGDTSYHYLSSYVGDGSREGTAIWTPDLDTAGTWRVEIWFRRTENRTDDADHYVTDGLGDEHHVSVDQSGDGESGWVDLGEYWCDAGSGGCVLTLDGDDGASDEANAARFTLVEADTSGGSTGESGADPCSEAPSPGTWTQTGYASESSDSGWDSASSAEGEADSSYASSENVDDGEYLRATGWGLCDPSGEETITAVTLSVRGKTQYDSGTYEVELLLDGGGSAELVWNGTSTAWHSVDLTGDDSSWTWDELNDLVASVTLYDHPGGRRDSDAWVDAFKLEVSYEVPTPATEDSGDPGSGGADTRPVGGTGGTGDTAPADPGGEETGASTADTGAPLPQDSGGAGETAAPPDSASPEEDLPDDDPAGGRLPTDPPGVAVLQSEVGRGCASSGREPSGWGAALALLGVGLRATRRRGPRRRG